MLLLTQVQIFGMINPGVGGKMTAKYIPHIHFTPFQLMQQHTAILDCQTALSVLIQSFSVDTKSPHSSTICVKNKASLQHKNRYDFLDFAVSIFFYVFCFSRC